MRTPALPIVLLLLAAAGACREQRSVARMQEVTREQDRPELYLPGDLAQRPDRALLRNERRVFDTDEEGQPDTVPPLPFGMTLQTIRDGDRIFHGRGGCLNCHGSEAQGLPARGKTLTRGLLFVPGGAWASIDSLVLVGMEDAQTRSPIAMPPRGQDSNLTGEETRQVAAYVWAISRVRGEPWPGGHRMHAPHDINASARTSIP